MAYHVIKISLKGKEYIYNLFVIDSKLEFVEWGMESFYFADIVF